jgi:branched-chain amino acid aminotransferase
MVNFNGTIQPNQTLLSIENRAYKFGDALFETIKCVNGQPLFWEDHYFRLMASMRILRMEIPMNFTMEFLQNEISKTLQANGLDQKPARVRLTIDRGEGGNYLPVDNKVNFSISAFLLNATAYEIYQDHSCEVDLFKDYFVNQSLLSTLKSANKLIQILGSIYAKENDLDNCILLNNSKNVVECLNGNIFLVEGNTIKTPSLSDGCLNGILRKQILLLLKKHEAYDIVEDSISTFELQKADELFYTNVIQGIVPITKYRKKIYETKVSTDIITALNKQLEL